MKTLISTRLNSLKARPDLFAWKYGENDTRDLMRRMQQMKEMEYYSMNYPEHLPAENAEDIKAYLLDTGLRLSSINLRYPQKFALGAFTNPSVELQKKAFDLTCEAIDLCEELNGSDVVLWMGPDGFDYSFQLDYVKAWKREIYWMGEAADYALAKNIRISIEYKPCEPRRMSLLSNFGLSMLAIKELDRPNIGLTCDICHMLMANESPAASIAIALQQKRLYGLHLNDGYSRADDGLAVGTVNFILMLEIFKYLADYDYTGFLYFDTFPINEDPIEEIAVNIQRVRGFEKMVQKISTAQLTQMTENQEGLLANQYIWNTIFEGEDA